MSMCTPQLKINLLRIITFNDANKAYVKPRHISHCSL